MSNTEFAQRVERAAEAALRVLAPNARIFAVIENQGNADVVIRFTDTESYPDVAINSFKACVEESDFDAYVRSTIERALGRRHR